MLTWLRQRLRTWLDVPDHPPAVVADERPKGMTIANTHLVAQLEADPYRRKLTQDFPALPFKLKAARNPHMGLDGEQAKMAMDDCGPGGFPFAGFLNTNTIAGLNGFGLYFPGYPYLAEIAQRSEFRQPVETTAKEMTRKWLAFKTKGTGKKDDKIKKLEDAFQKFKVKDLVRKALEHDGFYGMGFIFIDVRPAEGGTGADNRAEPLVIDSKTIPQGSLRGFVNVEPMWTTPLVWNSTDPTHPNFYKADKWMVLGREVDQTRLLRFVSREVPDIIRPAYNFGGISLSQLIESYVDRWLKTVGSVNRLINNFSIINLRTEMAGVLSGGPSTELVKRAQLFTKQRDNQGLFLTDKEAEELTQTAVPLTSLSELQAQAQEHMAAPTHLPLVVLTGITPSGLNASSDSEIEIFHDWIESSQETFTSNVTKISHIVQLSEFGEIDDDITLDWIALKQLTGEALARVKKTQSEMDLTYVDMGAVSPAEVRDRIARDPDSGYNNLSGGPPEGEDLGGAAAAREQMGGLADPETGERVDDDEEDSRGIPASAAA